MRDLISRRRPAPGTVLGLIAVVIAVAGTAIAAPIVTKSVLDKREKKQVKKIAQAQINAAAPALSVKSAADADRVDGHDAVCPTGSFLHAGACFETAGRGNSDWTGAAQTCADAGGYLPIPSELLSIRNVAGIDLGAPGAGSWADARYQDNGVNEAMTVVDNGTLEGVALAGPRDYRCAFKLVR